MSSSAFWTRDDYHAGNCRNEHVGMEKPAQFLRLQNENDIMKSQLEAAAKMIEKNGNSASLVALDREIADLKDQLANVIDLQRLTDNRVADADKIARERLQVERIALDKTKASLADQKAALEAMKASLAEQSATLQKEKAEIDKWRSHLAKEFAKLKEQQATLASNISLEERQKAIIDGDLTSITQSLVADIARLEQDIILARERMMAADKAHITIQREERQHWHTIYATATKELRAARQQLIQLPRPPSEDPKEWKNNLVAIIALAMEQGSVPSSTIREFVSRSTGMLANRSVRRVIADKVKTGKELAVPQ